MKSTYLIGLVFLIAGFCSCNTCTDCVPVTSNPFISVRFQIDTTNTNVNINLQTLNGIPAENILLIQEDTVSNSFQFPINLGTDTTIFNFDFFLLTDTLRQNLRSESLTMTYRRLENINERRRVFLTIDSIAILSSSFPRDTLTCFNPDNCTGDAHTVNLFL